ncbi:mitochondrial protein-like protein, partial [Usnea florida]
ISPLTMGTLTASLLLYPYSTLHAEAPPQEILPRKPIYDDLALLDPPKSSPTPTQASPSSSPTPTDRLAHHIKHARLLLHAHSLAAEDRLNAFMSAVLHQERSFTQTIASLAPPPETHERIMPGALYVLVAAMAGAIVSRNRNILLRATVPGAVGLGAAWVVLPVTMRNVGDLVWRFEERVPVVAINHMRVRGAVEEGWRQARVREEVTRKWFDERVGDGREAVEGWVRKGR